MPFFSRPDLSDLQFKQLPESELTLSGTTYFVKPGGIQVTDGSGNTVPIIATGATSGHVLTFLDGQIKLAPAGASTDILFNSCREVTRSGVPNINVSGGTVNEFLERYFFPAVGPSSSLSIASGGASREFGDTSVGNLSYSGVRETNQICLIALNDDSLPGYDTFPVTTPIAGNCSGTQPYTYSFGCATPPTGTSQTSVSFCVCVEDTTGCASVCSASITWRNKRFSFKSSSLLNASTIVNTMTGATSGELSTSIAKTLTQSFSNEFYYYAYPTSFGVPSFTVNGLPNNAWGNLATGTLFKFNFTNSQGYTNQYYAARSDSRITGSFNIAIS